MPSTQSESTTDLNPVDLKSYVSFKKYVGN
jgi:hypothetical protein